MTWRSKYPPIYVWPGDLWYNEKSHLLFFPDFEERLWKCESESVPFHKQTKVLKEKS